MTIYHRYCCDYAMAPTIDCPAEAMPWEAFPELRHLEPPCADPNEGAFVSETGWVYAANAETFCPKHDFALCPSCQNGFPRSELLENVEGICRACVAACRGCGGEKPADADPLCVSCRARSDRHAEQAGYRVVS
jgi:hypothetical protein